MRRALLAVATGSALLLAAGLAQAQAPSTVLDVNDTQFRVGETLALGLTATNPTGNPPADLYVGVFLPDGQSVIYFSGPGTLSPVMAVTALAAAPPFQPAPAGFSVSLPDFFPFTFPATGVPSGTYRFFANLIRQGAVADNRVDPGDLLATHEVSVNFAEAFSLEPASGASGTFVTALGTGFPPTAQVTVAGIPAQTVVVTSPTTISFAVPYVVQDRSPLRGPPGRPAS